VGPLSLHHLLLSQLHTCHLRPSLRINLHNLLLHQLHICHLRPSLHSNLHNLRPSLLACTHSLLYHNLGSGR
jgi:hypothetical protein